VKIRGFMNTAKSKKMNDFKFDKHYTFENERVLIRPLQASDLEHLLPVALSSPTLLQYSPSQIHDKIHLEQYINIAMQARQNHQRYAFIIFDKKHNQYAGSTSFGHISNKDKRLEIGWTWLHLNLQGTGLNGACKQLLIDFAFKNLEFERVEFKIDRRNIRSRKAVEKIGGKFEGELRSHTLMPDGHRRDTVFYSILKQEWV